MFQCVRTLARPLRQRKPDAPRHTSEPKRSPTPMALYLADVAFCELTVCVCVRVCVCVCVFVCVCVCVCV